MYSKGNVEVTWAFDSGRTRTSVFHISPHCPYDLTLGSDTLFAEGLLIKDRDNFVLDRDNFVLVIKDQRPGEG